MSDVSSPKASRQSRPRWLDPKLFLGILLVLSSMAIGARVVSEADDKVPVWVAAEDIKKDADLSEDQFEQANVGFESGDNADLYVSVTDPIPKNARALRDINAGELLPRNAMTTDTQVGLVDIPVPVSGTSLPAPISTGDIVDVWVVPGDANAAPTDPADPTDETDTTALTPGIRIFNGATVMTTPDGGGALGGGGSSGAVTIRTLLEADDWTLLRRLTPDNGHAELDMKDVTGFMADGTVTVVHHVAPKPVGE